MERIHAIKDAFNLFESIIDNAINSATPDDILIRSYFSIIETLKELTGTGRFATKFSEFFYVRYVKKFLETNLEKVSFIEEQTKGGNSLRFIGLYKEKKIILSSDISIKSAGISERPDIFVGIEKENGTIHPLAIFEVKLHQEPKQIADLITRFLKWKDDFVNKFSDEELPYFVWLYLRYEEYLKQDYEKEIIQFKTMSKNNLSIINEITEWNGNSYINNIRGDINSILHKIIEKIENF